MIHPHLIRPTSIAVIGASDNASKPGGKVLLNLIAGAYVGELHGVNLKPINMPGVQYCARIEDLPKIELAILAIPAVACETAMKQLLTKGARAFIIFSAGFGEAGAEGKAMEARLQSLAAASGASLVGPNCIGIINAHYKGVFTSPVPLYDPMGCELISGSGATAVFIMEAARSTGLRFSNVYTIGNAAGIGAEDLLEMMDQNYEPGKQPRIKLLYLEQIKAPERFMKHCASLVRKGCQIAAIKAGSSEAGSRAAASHTGALASSDAFVRAMFRKAGVVYCSGRNELITVAAVFHSKALQDNRLAVITHAGGSAVMLTDALSSRGMQVPSLEGPAASKLLRKLNPGSSVANPIDFLATGTAEQLGHIIDFCEADARIDGMAVVFGSPGLFQNIHDVYALLHQKIISCSKPIYPVLPSLVNARSEIEAFLARGHVNFPDEVVLGEALAVVFHRAEPNFGQSDLPAGQIQQSIRNLLDAVKPGFLAPFEVHALLSAAGLSLVHEASFSQKTALQAALQQFRFPVALKVIGPLHKTESGGVLLHLHNAAAVMNAFDKLMQIPDAQGVLLQEMKFGMEFYMGGIRQAGAGHLLLTGLGGIFLELLGDVANGLGPLTAAEALQMLRRLKAYPVLEGYRKKKGLNIELLCQHLVRLSHLLYWAPEIVEIDLNPLMCNDTEVVVVDARIRIG